jgi:hypothetical protein
MNIYYKTNAGEELLHYGVIGMKWGRRRALNAAKSAGRATSNARAATKESKRVASKFASVAKDAEEGARESTRTGKIGRAIATKKYADANRKREREVLEEGQGLANYYKKVSEHKTMKANKLAEKYGDEETKKKVKSLIDEYSKKQASGWEDRFDDTDPVVAAIRDTMEAAKTAQERYTSQKSSESEDF